MDLPLFPLHTVLCPGVALPLHVFEERYKAMIRRCLAAKSPFGVVLIREGREVGAGELAVAAVGTLAEIREATLYPDGRYDLVTLGTQRFRLEAVDPEAEPYLVGQITPMGEVLGEATRARALGDRVMQLFIRYLELLQVDEDLKAAGPDDAPSANLADDLRRTPAETPGEAWAFDSDEPGDAVDADAVEEGVEQDAEPGVAAVGPDDGDASSPTEDEVAAVPAIPERSREEILDEAARRLTIPEDPTVLSYLLSGIVQIESIRRQGLLEMPTTELRLVELAHLLDREIALLERGLGTYVPDPRMSMIRRN